MGHTDNNHEFEDPANFLESAAEAAHIASAQGIIMWANKKELDLLGYNKDEYIGHHISEFYNDKNTINDVLCKLIYNEEVENYVAELKRKDGSTVKVLLSSNIYVENGKFIHTRCFTRDISELKDMQHRMETTNAKILNQLISANSLLNYIASCAWKTSESGQVTKIQVDWLTYTGQILEEQLHYGWINAFHVEDRNKLKQDLLDAIRENRSFKQRARIYSKLNDGYLNSVIFAEPCLDLSNKAHEWLFILVDEKKILG